MTTCSPSRQIKRETLADAKDWIGLKATQTIPDSLRLHSRFDEWLALVEQAAVDAMRCEPENAVASLVAMGQSFEDVLYLARRSVDHAPTYRAEVVNLRNEYIRFIAEAFYTGCSCTDPDGNQSIQSLRNPR